ncbi:hypothetical protein [Bacillus sp. AK128]
MRVVDEDNHFMGLNETGKDKYSMKAEKDGVYKIVLKGNEIKGGFDVKWTIQSD